MSLTLQAPPDAALHDERAGLSRHWLLFLALGVLSVVGGLVAISSTFIATLASVKVFGALLLVVGAAEVIHAVMVRNLRGFALHLLAAALYLFVGFFIFEDPIRAAEVLTLILAASFIVGGLLRVVFSIALQFSAWQWVVLNGVIDLILGGLILLGWPGSSLWVIGLFVGIDLLFHGWSWVIVALTVRYYKSAQPA
jgi:uncharacterized membrane protein HdeD (DUF308 family)